MNRRKFSLIASVAVASAMVLSACGSSDGDQSGRSGDKTTMTAMFVGGTADKALIDIAEHVTEEFNENNEFNVEFELETYENEQYKTRLASLMTSNSQPDVFFTWSSGYLEPFVRGGKVLEMTPYLEADAEWNDRFQEGVFGPVTIDDKIYAVPHGQAVGVMFYNTKIFEENDLEVPTTYDEFVDVVTTLKNAGVTPISVPGQDAWIPGQFLQQIGNSVGGIELFDGIVAGEQPWNGPASLEAASLLNDLEAMGAFPPGYLGMTNDEGRNNFTAEDSAMYYMGSWDMAVLSEEGLPIEGNVGVFNIPAQDPGSEENVAVGDVDLAYAVSSEAKDTDAAVAFVKEFSEPEIQEMYAYDAQYLIATNTELDPDKVSPLYNEISELQKTLTGITPWWDRVFGAGEGVEFNNAAQGIIAGDPAQARVDELQSFAEANANR